MSILCANDFQDQVIAVPLNSLGGMKLLKPRVKGGADMRRVNGNTVAPPFSSVPMVVSILTPKTSRSTVSTEYCWRMVPTEPQAAYELLMERPLSITGMNMQIPCIVKALDTASKILERLIPNCRGIQVRDGTGALSTLVEETGAWDRTDMSWLQDDGRSMDRVIDGIISSEMSNVEDPIPHYGYSGLSILRDFIVFRKYRMRLRNFSPADEQIAIDIISTELDKVCRAMAIKPIVKKEAAHNGACGGISIVWSQLQ
jgi:hypothetical protein